MVSIWQLVVRIVAVVGSAVLVVVLAGVGLLRLVRRARRNTPPR